MYENMNMDNTILLSKNYDHLEEMASNRYGIKYGDHKLKIWGIRKYRNPNNNNISLKVCYDMADGDENDGCYEKNYNSKLGRFAEVHWDPEATRYLSLDPRYELYIKKLIKAVKKSNPDVEIKDKADEPFDFSQLVGLYVGGELGLEEFKKDGEITTRLSLFKFKSIYDLSDSIEPQVKLYDGTFQSYSNYMEEHQSNENEDVDCYTNLEKEEHYNNVYAERKETQEDNDLGFEEEELPF